MLIIKSPLEQFQILPVLSLRAGSFDFSVTNSAFILFLGLFFFCFILNSLDNNKGIRNVIPNKWQVLVEGFYTVVGGLLKDTVGSKGQKFFPYIFALFSFVLIANLIGLVPYSFTVTSHLIVTFSLALMTFLGINVVCIKEHGHHIFSLFLPAGSSLLLAFILIPIEIVSYLVRPISLSVRLFANMMAGHTLLKVIAGFSWSMMLSNNLFFFAHFLPLFILIIVMGLEFAVAIIQGYVFTILICIYLNDAINLH